MNQKCRSGTMLAHVASMVACDMHALLADYVILCNAHSCGVQITRSREQCTIMHR